MTEKTKKYEIIVKGNMTKTTTAYSQDADYGRVSLYRKAKIVIFKESKTFFVKYFGNEKVYEIDLDQVLYIKKNVQ